MKLEYDTAGTYIHPLNKADVRRLRPLIAESVLAKIARIRFGCNQRKSF